MKIKRVVELPTNDSGLSDDDVSSIVEKARSKQKARIQKRRKKVTKDMSYKMGMLQAAKDLGLSKAANGDNYYYRPPHDAGSRAMGMAFGVPMAAMTGGLMGAPFGGAVGLGRGNYEGLSAWAKTAAPQSPNNVMPTPPPVPPAENHAWAARQGPGVLAALGNAAGNMGKDLAGTAGNVGGQLYGALGNFSLPDMPQLESAPDLGMGGGGAPMEAPTLPDMPTPATDQPFAEGQPGVPWDLTRALEDYGVDGETARYMEALQEGAADIPSLRETDYGAADRGVDVYNSGVKQLNGGGGQNQGWWDWIKDKYTDLPTWAQYGIPLGALTAGGLGLGAWLGSGKDEEEEDKYAALKEALIKPTQLGRQTGMDAWKSSSKYLSPSASKSSSNTPTPGVSPVKPIKVAGLTPYCVGFLRTCKESGLDDHQTVNAIIKAAEVDKRAAKEWMNFIQANL